jgi:type II secretory pathway pseudopilin PulG
VIELMVVVAIIGMLSAIAAIVIRRSSYAGTAHGFAEQLAAEMDNASRTAIATRRVQEIEFGVGTSCDGQPVCVIAKHRTTQGMQDPTTGTYSVVRVLQPPRDITIDSVLVGASMTQGLNPGSGTNLPSSIWFMPDGSVRVTGGSGVTIYITDNRGEQAARVVVFAITSATHVFNDW